ncbi:hypothetical protein BGZ65_002840 [Modicella reniformis]|uniref:Protein-S-isoprenylcysteine O-methyltransferase n=1 Tax=Modicella reniformis TaxID=1440133 RepID=A0A9P6J9A8_9FUNG|nr:hypothetical protein BGZ65_002840 [Modicella reniformis]
MLVKALCLLITALTNLVCCRPPASAKTVSSKEDKIQAENPLTDVNLDIISQITVLATTSYLLLMILADYFQDIPAIQQLCILKSWHIAVVILNIASVLLRRWSYKTLDRFFTYQLTIRPGHQLVKTGPYRYLRHPSYTGLLVNFVGTFGFIYYEGLWDVFVAFATRIAAYFVHHKTPMLSTIALLSPFSPHVAGAGFPDITLGLSSGVWLILIFTALFIYLMWARIVVEEEMLRRHFKAEWDTYAKARWRIIPFVF